MKKFLATISILAMMVGFTACAAPAEVEKNLEGEIPDLLQQVIENADIENDEFKDFLLNGTQAHEITEDIEVYMLGSDKYEYVEAYAREPMMTSQAISFIMIRTETAAEAEKLAEEIVTTVDPRKWICVEVEKDNVKAATVGNMMFLSMTNEDSQKFIDAFKGLGE